MLIALNATTGGVCIISHVSIVDAPVGIATAAFTIVFSLATGIMKKLLKATKNKKKKHDKILMLALLSQALIDMEISHKEFIRILKETDKYEKMKENLRNVSVKLEEKQENVRLNSVNSRS